MSKQKLGGAKSVYESVRFSSCLCARASGARFQDGKDAAHLLHPFHPESVAKPRDSEFDALDFHHHRQNHRAATSFLVKKLAQSMLDFVLDERPI